VRSSDLAIEQVRQIPVSGSSTSRVVTLFPDDFFCAALLFEPYDASMKLIGRKTVKGGKTSAPMVKAAATMSKSKAAAASSVSRGEPSHEEIAARAYELYLARGSLDGYSEEDWLIAEAELRRK
jgi:Protein of unknown function (DUF2934)